MSESELHARFTTIVADVFPKSVVRLSLIELDDHVLLRIEGSIEGKSPRYAEERRRRLQSLLSSGADELGITLVVQFQLDDALERLRDAVLSVLRAKFGSGIRRADIDMRSTGSFEINVVGEGFVRELPSAGAVLKLAKQVSAGLGVQPSAANIMADSPSGSLSDSIVLRTIRERQPVGAERLTQLIVESSGAVAVEKEVRRCCDRLRQRGLVIFDSASRRYSLTAAGLSAMPGVPGRRSADVVRALELGRRRW